MSPFWNKASEKPSRHADPDEAIARYLEQLHQADVAGASPPASALNGLGDAYLDKGDVTSAVDHYRQAAEIYAREGMHTNAIACLKKVRRHALDEGDAGLLLGRYYAAKKLIPDAVAELEGFADRKWKIGDRKAAIEALREVARLAPADGERRERLGDLLRDDGQADAAAAAYREALPLLQEAGPPEAADRVRASLEELGIVESAPGPAAVDSPTPPPDIEPGEADLAPPPAGAPEPPPEGATPAEERPAVEAPPPAASGDETELPLGLEIQRTSYGEDHDETPPGVDEPDKLTISQQTSAPEAPVERAEIEATTIGRGGEEDLEGRRRPEAPTGPDAPEEPVEPGETAQPDEPEEREPYDLEGSPTLSDAAAELERAALDLEKPLEGREPAESAPEAEGIVPEPRSHEEMVALAESHVRAGEIGQAGKYLLIAAEGLRKEGEWHDAAYAYRRLAKIGEAKAEDFEDWAECARQAGRASEVLEALATAARWHLEKGNVPAARRSAEEMLLVDPDSDTAAELLERIGTLPSR